MHPLLRHIGHTCKQAFRRITNPVIGDIVVLHRVTPPDFILEPNRVMEITPKQLTGLISDYRRAGYRFVSLDEFLWHKKHAFFPAKPLVTITFDDGYADNFHIAYPLLKAQQVPFTLYVSTSFLRHEVFLWWYILEMELRVRDEIVIGNVRYPLHTEAERNAAFRAAHAELSQMETADGVEWFAQHSIEWHRRNEDLNSRLGMTEAELRQMAADTLCTIGSHTCSHARMTKLSEPAAQTELRQSKALLEDIIGNPVRHFSYPYGDYNPAVAQQVRAAGYQSAVTVVESPVTRKQDVYRLNRTKVKTPPSTPPANTDEA